jgi:hypothetical protein
MILFLCPAFQPPKPYRGIGRGVGMDVVKRRINTCGAKCLSISQQTSVQLFP